MGEAIRSSVPPAPVPGPPRPPVPWAPPEPPRQTPSQHAVAPVLPRPPAPARPPGVNGFAIAALVVGLAGGPVIGMWLASVAIRQIRAGGGTGLWMAVTGLVASLVWTLAIVVPVSVSLVV